MGTAWPRHATLATRKAVFARTAIMDAFADIDAKKLTAQQHAEAVQAREELLSAVAVQAHAIDENGLPEDGERLDHLAEDFANGHVDARLKLARGSGNSMLVEILTRLQHALRTIDCGTCAGHGRAPCGPQPNHATVASGGHCIDEIRTTFDFVHDVAGRLYDEALGAVGAVSSQVDVQLGTSTFDAEALPAARPKLTAVTRFGLTDGRHVSDVVLSIDGHHYGPEERAAVPYVLMHELVAHAFFDASCVRARQALDPLDPWAEGWMDCVALDLLEDALTSQKPGAPIPPRHLRGDPLVLDVARRLHVDRFTGRRAGREVSAIGLRAARGRFGNMAARLRRAEPLGGGHDPMGAVRIASALINAAGASSGAVAWLTGGAQAFVNGARAGGGLTEAERSMYEALVAFNDHRDDVRLVAMLAR